MGMAVLIIPRRFTIPSLPPSLSRFPVPFSKIRVRVGAQVCVATRPRCRRISNSMSQPGPEVPTGTNTGAQNDAVKADTNDVLVQYVVLRRDLIDSWPLGSVVTQGCHASVAAIWEHKEDSHTISYCSPDTIDFMHKVTLEVKGEPQILNLSEKLKAGSIAHKLWIEQPENIPTCIATKPYPKSVVSSYFKKLKLCK